MIAWVLPSGAHVVGLSEGLQNALIASGGTPKEHRTDSLSAAYRNLGGHRTSDLTRLYDDLCTAARVLARTGDLRDAAAKLRELRPWTGCVAKVPRSIGSEIRPGDLSISSRPG